MTPNSFASSEDTTKAPIAYSSLPVLTTNIGSQFLSSSLPENNIYTTSNIFQYSTKDQDQTKQASSVNSDNRNSIITSPYTTPISTITTTPKYSEYVVKSHSSNMDKKHLPELTSVLKSNGNDN